MSQVTLKVRMPFFACIGLLLILIWLGIRFFLAGFFDYQAQAFLYAWQDQSVSAADEPPKTIFWESAYIAAQRAISWSPVQSAARWERLGLIYAWRYPTVNYGAAQAKDARHSALEAYRLAIKERPDWPYAWVYLAQAKLSLMAIDAEFIKALQEAARLGPWRPDIQSDLAELGLQAWPRLSPEMQALTLTSFKRAFLLRPAQGRVLAEGARALGTWSLLCWQLTAKERATYGLPDCSG